MMTPIRLAIFGHCHPSKPRSDPSRQIGRVAVLSSWAVEPLMVLFTQQKQTVRAEAGWRFNLP
jgi:hypothetical protein